VSIEGAQRLKARGRLTPQKQDEYRAALVKVQAMEKRHREARSEGERQLLRIDRWVLRQWEGENQVLLERTPNSR